ncbi:MAG TPA: cell division protein ZapA [Psychromonas hadalis]|nr:cell division protein ZapA [Psychromonas hadalis]
MPQLNISILGQQYKVGCPEGEEESLRASAEQFQSQLLAMKNANKNLRNEQLIVISALNFCHQLNIEKKKTSIDTEKLNQRIVSLKESIEKVIHPLV